MLIVSPVVIGKLEAKGNKYKSADVDITSSLPCLNIGESKMSIYQLPFDLAIKHRNIIRSDGGSLGYVLFVGNEFLPDPKTHELIISGKYISIVTPDNTPYKYYDLKKFTILYSGQ